VHRPPRIQGPNLLSISLSELLFRMVHSYVADYFANKAKQPVASSLLLSFRTAEMGQYVCRLAAQSINQIKQQNQSK
jgi:hypothetical protein